MLLREFMVKAGICSESDDDQTFIDELSWRYISAKGDAVTDPRSDEKKVRRWFKDECAITHRETAVEICFVLGLDEKDTAEFLYKCGFHGFNARNAEDAIYLYCILNRRKYSDAQALMYDYCRAVYTGTVPEPSVQAPEIPHGQTTVILEQTLLGDSDWDSDEAFLQTFLLPNKERFTGFSKTADAAYHKLKNRVYLTVILWQMEEENRRNSWTAEADCSEKDVPFIWRFRAACEMNTDSSGVRKLPKQPLPKKALKDYLNAAEQIAREQLPSEDPEVQKSLSELLDYVMSSEENFIRTVLPVLTDENNRPRKYKESEIGKTVLHEFPNGKKLKALEKMPSALYSGVAGRKAILLMYYLDFVYKWSVRINDMDYDWDTDEELSFSAFLDGANALLETCRLPLLYPANRFDWLILYSVQQFVLYDLDPDDEDPVQAFREVLRVSFGDPEEDSEEADGFS